jgi:hypothetical protein
MPAALGHIAHLRELLHELENEAGLLDLSEVERLILYAMNRIAAASEDGTVRTDEMRAHVLLTSVTQPTFYRALRTLRDKRYVDIAPNARTKTYVLTR